MLIGLEAVSAEQTGLYNFLLGAEILTEVVCIQSF